jgi:hypothetical protein
MTVIRDVDPNSMVIWWPAVLQSGVPGPRTELVRCPEPGMLDEWAFAMMDHKPAPAGWLEFMERLMSAVQWVGLPCFIRTDLASSKHEWRDTCLLESESRLESQLLAIMDGCLAGFGCDNHSAVAVRELLRFQPAFIAEGFGGMPVGRERQMGMGVPSPVIRINPVQEARKLAEQMEMP